MVLLASASPQRKRLLAQIGIEPHVFPSAINEELDTADVVGSLQVLARRKAETALSRFLEKSDDPCKEIDFPIWTIGADTVISFAGRIIGKVKSENEAQETLDLLSGQTHSVLTGVCVVKVSFRAGKVIREEPVLSIAETSVSFKDLSELEIKWYISTGEWRGAAGAYRIQKKGACIVESIQGSYSNVVGLPIGLIYGILGGLGFSFEAW